MPNSIRHPDRRFWLAAAALGMAALWSGIVWLEGRAVAAAETKLSASRGTLTVSTALRVGHRKPALGLEVRYTNLARDHSLGRVKYTLSPPVGGTHDPLWLNCGVYDVPVRNENAVHSLEHGAVWITYRPDQLAALERQRLEVLGAQPKVLVSPYTAQPAPIIASAWGVQLQLGRADIQRLEQFIAAYRDQVAPEPQAPCVAGTGLPGSMKKEQQR